MTRDELDIAWQMAIHQSVIDGDMYARYRFAEMLVKYERDQCAKVCEEKAKLWHSRWKARNQSEDAGREAGAIECADAIRSRCEQ